MSKTNILLESGTNELEIVEFTVDEIHPDGKSRPNYYGVNVAKVLEIVREPKVTGMPEMNHECIKGAFNLRSKIIPLIDLGLWLGISRKPSNAAKCIITEFNSVTNAFLVSNVNRIHRLNWEDVEAPSEHLTTYSSGSITGVVRLEGRIVFLLDMEKIVGELNPRLALRLEDQDKVETLAEPESVQVLIVDDSNTILKTMARGLRNTGYKVYTATHGRDAYDKLLKLKDEATRKGVPLTDIINIVVSDIEMPVMDGHNLTKRIKDDPELSSLPVILFSSLITPKLEHQGKSVGADAQISKPNLIGLNDTIKDLLKEKQGIII